MKKLLVMSLLISVASYSMVVDNVKVYGGANINRNYGGTATVSGVTFDLEDVKGEAGYCIGAEVHKKINDVFEIGAGVKYNTPLAGKDNPDIDMFSTMPFYLSGKVIVGDSFNYYIQGLVGYSINQVFSEWTDEFDNPIKIDSGLYYGVGFGIEMSGLSLEAIYDVTKVQGDITGGTFDTDLSQISLLVGYKFGE